MWGTCLGFQDLVRFGADDKEHIGDFTNEHYAEPLKFIVDPADTIIFRDFSQSELETLQTKNTSYLSHHHGFSLADFANDAGIKKTYRPTSTMVAEEKTEFVSSMEAYDYPFYGTQFHPEKQYLSFAPDYAFQHTEEIEKINRNYADFFVGQARKNTNKFETY